MLKGGVSRSPPGLPPPARHRSTPQRCAGPRLERADERVVGDARCERSQADARSTRHSRVHMPHWKADSFQEADAIPKSACLRGRMHVGEWQQLICWRCRPSCGVFVGHMCATAARGMALGPTPPFVACAWALSRERTGVRAACRALSRKSPDTYPVSARASRNNTRRVLRL